MLIALILILGSAADAPRVTPFRLGGGYVNRLAPFSLSSPGPAARAVGSFGLRLPVGRGRTVCAIRIVPARPSLDAGILGRPLHASPDPGIRGSASVSPCLR